MQKLLLSLSLVGSLVALAQEAPKTAAAAPAAPEKKATAPKELPKGWTDDFEAAKKQAAAEKKDLLLDFSGSDWCGWCMKLDKEVFSLPEFTDTASKNFVMVLVDSPRDTGVLSETAKKQNPELVAKFKIRGFPTVLLLDANGQEYARTGYQEGGPAPYLKSLDQLQQDGHKYLAAMVEINKLQGAERAKAIDALLSTWTMEQKQDDKGKILIKEMFAIDAGLKPKYPYFAEIMPIEEQMEAAYEAANKAYKEKVAALPQKDGKPDREAMMAVRGEVMKQLTAAQQEAQAKLNAALPKLQGEDLQLGKLFGLQMSRGSVETAIAGYREIQAIAPETATGKKLAETIVRMEEYKKKMEEQKAKMEAEKKAKEAAQPAEAAPAPEKK